MSGPSDIIVVGAGVVGCAIAYELARRGASVEIVDDRAVGMGATQASAGVLAPFIEAREGNPLLDLAVRSLDLYDDFIAHVSADGGGVVPYRRTEGGDQNRTSRPAQGPSTPGVAAGSGRRAGKQMLRNIDPC